MTLPTFPTLDMADGVNWFMNGAVALFTANFAVIAACIIVLGLLYNSPKLVKRLVSKVG
ncbi:hypothetical protein [Pseudolactococcus carnosus]|uniref:Uncharacterized protein n=1 Tax=Pseudolactococcus carnosus TaxID=2749961 RepID=A0ABT0AVA3_9LACT|nr:hypothetical protein [Lactococcus carnosus]MCJ1990529.1 hypothetical protein [Lactococcus carnosus]